MKRELKENEIRVIKISKIAIKELINEYLMQIGDSIMDIPKNDDASALTIDISDDFNKLTIFAYNVEDYIRIGFDTAGKVFSNISNGDEITTDTLFPEVNVTQKRSNKLYKSFNMEELLKNE